MTLFAFLSPATDRAILIVVVGGCYLGYHLYHLWRWWQAKREKVTARGEGEERNSLMSSEGAVGRAVPRAPQSSCNEAALNSDCGGQGTARPTTSPQGSDPIDLQPSPTSQTSQTSQPSQTPQPPQSPLTGEELYAQARVMPHRTIPDCERDGEYLKLLVKSADLGYARAASKLGEYAMRRACMVEAYYWFSMAKKNGMRNLDRTMLQVRSVWANGGFRRESANEYEHFPHERGSVGYALLCIAARHNADAAKARLAECAPEFLV